MKRVTCRGCGGTAFVLLVEYCEVCIRETTAAAKTVGAK